MQYTDVPAACCKEDIQHVQYDVVRKLRTSIRKVDKIKNGELLTDTK